MLFTAADPLEDLMTLARAKNPQLTHPTAAFTVTNVATSSSGRNTTITLRANVEYGIKGTFSVMLDRTRLEELYNKFPSGNKKPIYKMFGGAGSTISFSTIIDQINALLGTKLTITGDLQDLVDTQFVLPSKDASVTVTVKASPKSVRLVPDTTLDIEIHSSGAIITNTLVNRSLNPIIGTNGLISYAGISVNPAAPKRHPGYAMKYLDFSAIMAGRGINEVVNQVYQYPNYILTMNASLFSAINTKLSANGLSPLAVNSLGVWDAWAQSPIDKNRYWNNIMFCRTADYASDPLVNSSEFAYFLRLRRSELQQSESSTSYASDYYMHYNQ